MERKKLVQLSQKGKKLIADYLNELDSHSAIQSESFKLICCICKQYCDADSKSRFPVIFKNSWDEGGGIVSKKIKIMCEKCFEDTQEGV